MIVNKQIRCVKDVMRLNILVMWMIVLQ